MFAEVIPDELRDCLFAARSVEAEMSPASDGALIAKVALSIDHCKVFGVAFLQLPGEILEIVDDLNGGFAAEACPLVPQRIFRGDVKVAEPWMPVGKFGIVPEFDPRGNDDAFLRNDRPDLSGHIEPDPGELLQKGIDAVQSAGFAECAEFELAVIDLVPVPRVADAVYDTLLVSSADVEVSPFVLDNETVFPNIPQQVRLLAEYDVPAAFRLVHDLQTLSADLPDKCLELTSRQLHRVGGIGRHDDSGQVRLAEFDLGK